MIFNRAKYDAVTIGGATEDITFYTDEGILIDNKEDLTRQKLLAFEYGAKIKIDKSFSHFGGGAANAAVGLAGFGFKAAALAAIGEDSRGERIKKNLKDRGVDVSLIKKIKSTESGFSFLLVGPQNEHIVFSNRAANNELRINNYELRILNNTKWIYLTSLSGRWQENLRVIFSVKGVKAFWNPGHRQIITGLKTIGKYLARVEVLQINKDEAIELVMSDKKYRSHGRVFLSEVKNLLKVLHGYGPRIVVITKGRYGADAFDGNKFYFQPVIKEKRRADTTGVGDAFGSAFVAGLEIYQGNIKKAMLLGARNTASVISQPGAQNGLLTKKDL